MSYKKGLTAVVTVFFILCQTVFCYDATFVNEEEQKPLFDIFSIFGKKQDAENPNAENSVETSVTQNAGEFQAQDGILNVTVNTPAQGSLNSTIPDEGTVVFSIETQPQKGTVEITDTMTGDFIYTPNQDEMGTDSFVFTVTSETHGTDTAIIYITIEEAEEPGDGDEEEEEEEEEEPPVYSFRYEDMYDHWGEYSAIKIGERDVFRGFKIGQKYYFYPESELTRGDFLLYLVGSLGIDVSQYNDVPSPFADAETTPAWMNLQAKAAYDAGIIKGSKEGDAIYLNASDKLTRIEAIAMLNNIIKPDAVVVGNTDEYTDIYLVPQWGQQFVNNMSAYGLIQGYDDGSIRPFAKITRAMSAEMLLQTLKYKDEHPDVMQKLTMEMDESTDY